MAKVVIADTNLGDGTIECGVLAPKFEVERANGLDNLDLEEAATCGVVVHNVDDALEAKTLGYTPLEGLQREPPNGVSAEIDAYRSVLATPHVAYLSAESLPLLLRRAAEIIGDALTKAK